MARAFRILAGILALLAALVAAEGARAHATLVASEPADGAVLAEAPGRFRLSFNEPVAATSIALVGAGTTRPLDAIARDASIEIAAPAGLTEGSYALSYRVVSEDGHPIAGAIAFSIGTGGGPPQPVASAPDRPLQAATWAARVAFYLGLMLGAGGAFARAFLTAGAPHGRRFAVVSTAIGLAAAPAALALLGADLIGAPLAGALEPAAWAQALATSYARTAAVAAAALVLALASLAASGLTAKTFAIFALFGVGLALALSGHASAAAPQWLMRPAVFVHVVAAAFWLGALAPLFLALAHDPSAANGALRRFSVAAPFAVAALGLAGVALAIVQSETPAALWTTGYGRVLAAKLALVAALLGLAAANRLRWTKPALKGDPRAARSLRRSIATELVVGAAILGVVALWRFTPPPRVVLAEEAAPALAYLHSRAAQADVTLSPGRAGRSDMTIVVMTGDYGPLDAKELTVVLSHPAAGVEPIRRAARKPGDGTWRVGGLTLPVSGRWTVRIEILVTDFDIEKLESDLDVRR